MKRRTKSAGDSTRAAAVGSSRAASVAAPEARGAATTGYEWLENAKLPAHRTALDLPLLELECMKILWQLGESRVAQIREILRRRRPLAYTTVETLINRLLRKGLVGRRKEGAVFVYWPECTREEACQHALQRVVDHFFFGSRTMLQSYLSGKPLPASISSSAAGRPRTRLAAWTKTPARGRAAKREASKPEPAGAAIETSLL